MDAPAFAEARAICAQQPVDIVEMIEVLDATERRVTGERERAMCGCPNPALYREPVVLDAILTYLRRVAARTNVQEFGR